jgi:signal transduction histidine kinase
MYQAEFIKRKGSHQELVGEMLFNPVVRDLGNVVQKTMNMMKVKINSKQINISSTIAENVYVYADKDMLDLIIRNLVSNAVKFTEIGGSIQLSSEVLQDKVVVAIRDTGHRLIEI